MAKKSDLLKLAEQKDSLFLYKLANSDSPKEKFDYLQSFIEDNGLSTLAICGDTLANVVSANAKRYEQLTNWIEQETNEEIKKNYVAQQKKLGAYVDLIIADLISKVDEYSEQAKKDNVTALEAAVEKATESVNRAKALFENADTDEKKAKFQKRIDNANKRLKEAKEALKDAQA